MEVWKPIPGHPDHEASSEGRIRRAVRGNNYPAGHIIKAFPTPRGYRALGIWTDGKRVNCLVHRLVGMAFLPPIEGKPFINHINSIRHDNRAANLEWCTRTENLVHSYRVGGQRLVDRTGPKNPNTRLNAEAVLAIRARRAAGEPSKDIAADFGVTHQAVDQVVKRLTWRHVT